MGITYITKDAALEAMKAGKTVAHVYFSDDEYLYMKDGIIYDENGYKFTEGWRMRTGGAWEDGWLVKANSI